VNVPTGAHRTACAYGTVTELRARQQQIEARRHELNHEHEGRPFTNQARTEWDELNMEYDDNEELIEELGKRGG
jgi:hypothetical protein